MVVANDGGTNAPHTTVASSVSDGILATQP
eukprot:SAG25_NODE_788_length_5307_cov_2.800115_1_plen_29_part_10